MSEDQLEASQGGKRVIHELGETLFRVRPLRWTLEKRSKAPPGRYSSREAQGKQGRLSHWVEMWRVANNSQWSDSLRG